ncbi:MAG: HAD hydrolase-like protein [Planctomycetia bacterium]|nr:HAD hydrolase-like protein [Planctomycetia bacterium]
MLKAVILDFDGTIGDTLALCLEAFKSAIEPLAGRTFTEEEIIATFGPSEEGTIAKLVLDQAASGVAGYLREYERLHVKYDKPFPGILELLRTLKKRGLLVALVTGKGRYSCDISLAAYGLTDFFDAVETGSALGPCKPVGLRSVLTRFKLLPQEAVYVGDTTSDVAACQEVGIPVIAAAWASTANPEQLAATKPDRLCRSITQLHDTLEDMMTTADRT